MIDPQKFAESTLSLLQQKPERYLNFGTYWFFVKALLKRYYSRENLNLLGEYMDPDCMARMPEHADLQGAILASIQEYQENATFNLMRNQVPDRTGGGVFTLNDEDF